MKNAEDMTPHKLRRTFAMKSLAAGEDISVVKEQLGHNNLNTTQIYARATDEDKKAHRNDVDLF